MEVIGCGKGHFYNPNEYSSCPQCAKEAGMEPIGVTVPVGETGQLNSDAPAAVPGATEPINGWGSVQQSHNSSQAGNILSTSYFDDGVGSVDAYGPTTFVGGFQESAGAAASSQPQIPLIPVVGWLVCVDGASKGRDYRIHSQYNYIGRARHMDICISGDDCISAERAAIIAYDDQEKVFSFGPGTGHNIVRVNGKMVMNAVLLNAFDELTIGKTKLLFVPFCGERFDWNGR